MKKSFITNKSVLTFICFMLFMTSSNAAEQDVSYYQPPSSDEYEYVQEGFSFKNAFNDFKNKFKKEKAPTALIENNTASESNNSESFESQYIKNNNEQENIESTDTYDAVALHEKGDQDKSEKQTKKFWEHLKKDNDEEIEEQIINNKLYLDRFKIEDQAKIDEYYKERNLLVKPNGDIELILQSDSENGIDTLIKQIESVSPEDTFSPEIELSLKDSIAIAIAKHPSIKSARLYADMTKARIIAAWAAYFPTFSVGFDYSHSYSKTEDYPSYRVNTGTIPNATAGLLLYDFGKTKVEVDIAKVDYSATEYDLQSTINDLIYSVKSAYFQLLFAQHQVDVYEQTIKEFDLQVRSAKKFFSIGKKAQIDVDTAEFNAGNARLNLVKAKNTLETAKVTFANALGLPEFANFRLSEGLPREEYALDLETILKNAFYIRPDLISYEKQLENAKLGVRRALRAFTPDITANGMTGYSRADSEGTASYGFGASLNYSINYLQLRKEYDIAKLAYEKAKYDYELKKQSVYLEVKQAYIDLNNTLQTVYQADQNVKFAKAQSYQATGRYNAGLSTAIELKDSENTYMNSQLEYFSALLAYNDAIATLERVVGKPIESQHFVQNVNNEEKENSENVIDTPVEENVL